MQEFRLETTRLYLRPFREEDAEGFFQLNADPEVIRHTGDAAFRSVEEARTFIRAYDHYQKYGYGRWSIVLKETDVFIGFCGLKFHPDQQWTDIGFRLARQYWGQGLATEAAKRCLDYGFGQLGIERIVGRARQANTASIRVLEKLGMLRKGSFDFEGHPGYWYEIWANDHSRMVESG